MALKDEIVGLLVKRPGMTDREIADALRGTTSVQQPINIACRQLEADGVLSRRKTRPADNLIGNYLSGKPRREAGRDKAAANPPSEHGGLSEDAIKEVLAGWLQSSGWKTKIAWGQAQGIDIEATRGSERWVIEVKGPGSRQQMRVNYFLAILGETLQRMSDEKSSYSIALPDMPQYRGLWNRLPNLAKSRTGISLLLVSENREIEHLGAL